MKVESCLLCAYCECPRLLGRACSQTAVNSKRIQGVRRLSAEDRTENSANCVQRDPTRTTSLQRLAVPIGNGEATWQEWTNADEHALR